MERKSGVKKDTLAGYPDTVIRVATAEKATLIDLHAMSRLLYAGLVLYAVRRLIQGRGGALESATDAPLAAAAMSVPRL